MNFSLQIIQWYHEHQRDLPWRNTTDPYLIWLSEIILQQTRVDQGLKYYHAFAEQYPTVGDLASADQDEVLKLWQGLGYYSRARNLHKASKMVAEELKGRMPQSYEELLKLPGVGSYTAAAIASFAYREPVPVVDGNVFRVLSRYFGIEEFIDTNQGKKAFLEVASACMDVNTPDTFNQAIMEFGALNCTPKKPLCDSCPLHDSCQAFKLDKVSVLPRKKGKVKVKKLHLNYLVCENEDRLLMYKRPEQGIWAGLYDFPALESFENETEERQSERMLDHLNSIGLSALESRRVAQYKHLLSHRDIRAVFTHIHCHTDPTELPDNHLWVKKESIGNLGVSRLTELFLEQFN